MEHPKAPAPGQDPRLDEKILQGVCLRQPEALNKFFDHFYDRVYGYLEIMLRDRHLAEDLTQEAFLRIHRGVDRLDPRRDPTGWVFTVVINTVRDFWRSKEHKAAARRTTLDETRGLSRPDDTPTADRNLERQDEARSIRRALTELSEDDREIILLRNYEELNTATIAGMLDLKADAVRQRHSRAVTRLGKAFKKIADEELRDR